MSTMIHVCATKRVVTPNFWTPALPQAGVQSAMAVNSASWISEMDPIWEANGFALHRTVVDFLSPLRIVSRHTTTMIFGIARLTIVPAMRMSTARRHPGKDRAVTQVMSVVPAAIRRDVESIVRALCHVVRNLVIESAERRSTDVPASSRRKTRTVVLTEKNRWDRSRSVGMSMGKKIVLIKWRRNPAPEY